MAKKNKKIEKETRRLIEAISDVVRRKDGKYKFKGLNKKEIRTLKRDCPHWIIRKGTAVPTVVESQQSPGFWTCELCGASFKVRPFDDLRQYQAACKQFLSVVDQVFFYSVRMGGDADDTRMFLMLKKLVPRFGKVAKNAMKQLKKKEEYEKRNRNAQGDGGQFGHISSYNYKP